MNNSKGYKTPMVDLKNWYKKEIESVGHLAAMRDEYLRRRYASRVVSGMKHLSEAIAEKMDMSSNSDRRTDLQQMMNRVQTAMNHVKQDYDVTENNISYSWNTGANATVATAKANANKTALMTTPEALTPEAMTANLYGTAEGSNMNMTPMTEEAPIMANNNMNSMEEGEEFTPIPENLTAKTAATPNGNALITPEEEMTAPTADTLNEILREVTGTKKENKNKNQTGGKRRTTKKRARKASKKTRRH